MTEFTIIVFLLSLTILLLLIVLIRTGKSGTENRMLRLGKEQSKELSSSLSTFRETLDRRFDALDDRNRNLQSSINQSMDMMRRDNAVQLERMRVTVDERLQSTLETRLTKSFEQVQKQLESVYKGLGEMQGLAKNVGDLSRLFSNVKTRGVWGEVQAQAILSEILTNDQYVTNYHPRPRSLEVVEFAIRLPGKKEGENVYLPIDSKFPKEDYENFLKSQEHGDIEGVKFYRKAMQARVISEAKDIRDKYINPPNTTDFAILFLPTESLYAELLAISGLAAEIQLKYRVTLSGPSTLASLINTLQMGFQTIAVEKRSYEVWKLFAQMRKSFTTFSEDLRNAERSVDLAARKLENLSQRSGKIEAKLSSMEIPEVDSL
ncbi:MAG: DNA recombination protein RmuC, partial [Sphaerochaetaceae bacterium]|nr:DNA recombination protein RmuC [Sphaerochaetaceae bacterium]